MWCCLLFTAHGRRGNKQTQRFDLGSVLLAAGDDIAPGGVDAAVAQNICQPGDIPLLLVESPGKEVAQIVGIYLFGGHACRQTQGLHGAPDVAAVQHITLAGDKDRPGGDGALGGVAQQHLTQPPGNEDDPAPAVL